MTPLAFLQIGKRLGMKGAADALAKFRKMPKSRFYIVTGGDGTCDVEFFPKRREYDAAVKLAEEQHDAGELDHFQYGEVE